MNKKDLVRLAIIGMAAASSQLGADQQNTVNDKHNSGYANSEGKKEDLKDVSPENPSKKVTASETSCKGHNQCNTSQPNAKRAQVKR